MISVPVFERISEARLTLELFSKLTASVMSLLPLKKLGGWKAEIELIKSL